MIVFTAFSSALFKSGDRLLLAVFLLLGEAGVGHAVDLLHLLFSVTLQYRQLAYSYSYHVNVDGDVHGEVDAVAVDQGDGGDVGGLVGRGHGVLAGRERGPYKRQCFWQSIRSVLHFFRPKASNFWVMAELLLWLTELKEG